MFSSLMRDLYAWQQLPAYRVCRCRQPLLLHQLPNKWQVRQGTRPRLACARAQKQITVQEHVLISSNLKRDAIFGLHENARRETGDERRERRLSKDGPTAMPS